MISLFRAQRHRAWVGLASVGFAWLGLGGAVSPALAAEQFSPLEADIGEIHGAYADGRLSVVELVRFYVQRMDRFDPSPAGLNAIAARSRRALALAEAQDAQLQGAGVPSGQPLFGIPLLVKDNIETGELPVTAGSALLRGFVPAGTATLVRRLRGAGAIVLGTANMHEFAYGIESVGSGFGFIRNPYDGTRHPGGSSGGTAAAVSANFALAGIGTDTCGSVRNPAAHNALVGVRGTQGLVSRHGIVPLSLTQDIAGPLARSVADAARILAVIQGYDPADPQTARTPAALPDSYEQALASASLAGARIGVVSDLVRVTAADEPMAQVFEGALRALTAAGAELVPINPLPLAKLVYAREAGFYILTHDFARDIDVYLGAHRSAPIQSLVELVSAGRVHPAVQPLLEASLATRSDPPRWYAEEQLKRVQLADALLARLADNQLDALVYPTIRQQASKLGEPQAGSNCHLSANSGLPAVTVPMGYTADGMPAGLEFLGRPWAEAELLALAAAYERATRHRRPPALDATARSSRHRP